MIATLRQSSVDPVVAANLRRALQQRGRTAYSVATALGRAPNWLYRVINGNAGILIPTLREVAAELGVAVGSLLDPPHATHVGTLEDELPYAAVLRPRVPAGSTRHQRHRRRWIRGRRRPRARCRLSAFP